MNQLQHEIKYKQVQAQYMDMWCTCPTIDLHPSWVKDYQLLYHNNTWLIYCFWNEILTIQNEKFLDWHYSLFFNDVD